LVGQPAVVLQGSQHFEVEGVGRYHALNARFMHESCVI
jgi:hypothetical protein